MTRRLRWLAFVVAALSSGALGVRPGGESVAAQDAIADLQIDQASIGGVVLNSGSQQPEAGVWVIAQATSLPTPFRRIVVTDDQGRFVVPDLPESSYRLWVRGYGLGDSNRVGASRGSRVKLEVSSASDPQEAAKIYPAGYWWSLFEPPPAKELPKGFTSREHWIAQSKNTCGGHCHAVGAINTRLATGAAQWELLFNRHGGMRGEAAALGMDVLTKRLADWASRTWAGEVPPAPARPSGIERNIVLSQWDWGLAESFIHDLISTDKRKPTLYPYGPVYGLDSAVGAIWALDPVRHTIARHDVQPRASRAADGYNPKLSYYHDGSSVMTGMRQWATRPHNPMLDDAGRVWMTQQIRNERPEDYPKWVRKAIVTETNSPAELDAAEKLLKGSSHGRQLGYFDTKTRRFAQVDTVFGTHHLQFDQQGRIWANSSSGADRSAVGMFDPSKFNPDRPEETEADAQKVYVRLDPKTLNHIPAYGYAVIPNPVDGTVWQADSQPDGANNKLFVLDPKTGKFKDYPLPSPGRLPHGIDASTDGKLWFPTGSGHLGRFDPQTEQFTYWELPGPKHKNTGKETGSAQWSYFLWVDQFDALGLGRDTVIVCGTSLSTLQAFDPRAETFTVITIPYPLTFYTRGLDGRIDDPKAGWKGRGLWVGYNGYLPRLFTETGIGAVVHVQLRPTPLAY